jgi:hypothetical protein
MRNTGLFLIVQPDCLKHTVGWKLTSGFINVHAVGEQEHRYKGNRAYLIHVGGNNSRW